MAISKIDSTIQPWTVSQDALVTTLELPSQLGVGMEVLVAFFAAVAGAVLLVVKPTAFGHLPVAVRIGSIAALALIAVAAGAGVAISAWGVESIVVDKPNLVVTLRVGPLQRRRILMRQSVVVQRSDRLSGSALVLRDARGMVRFASGLPISSLGMLKSTIESLVAGVKEQSV